MKTKWVVYLLQQPIINDYRSDFFPRVFHYKKDALELIEEVEIKGGKAALRKERI